MGNRRKQDGTAWETALVRMARERGWESWRISEGGQYDYGDVAIRVSPSFVVVVEAKNRTQMNLHVAVEKARGKVHAQVGRIPHSVSVVAVAWKRLVGSGGNRRVQAGRPVVAVDLDDFLDLLGRVG